MKRLILGMIIGALAALAFIYFGGAAYIRGLGRGAERAARRMERYERGMHRMTKSAREAKRKAEEAGRKLKRYIP